MFWEYQSSDLKCLKGTICKIFPFKHPKISRNMLYILLRFVLIVSQMFPIKFKSGEMVQVIASPVKISIRLVFLAAKLTYCAFKAFDQASVLDIFGVRTC